MREFEQEYDENNKPMSKKERARLLKINTKTQEKKPKRRQWTPKLKFYGQRDA